MERRCRGSEFRIVDYQSMLPGWHDGAVRIATIQRSHAQVSVEAKADVLTVRGHSLPGVQTLFAREGSMRLLEDLS